MTCPTSVRFQSDSFRVTERCQGELDMDTTYQMDTKISQGRLCCVWPGWDDTCTQFKVSKFVISN